ncbi:MAG: alpha/beta fold hydrolase [Anaerolineales bacterium]|nr:alpha/beta fold hydrolase [Anaerolineales bacterium]
MMNGRIRLRLLAWVGWTALLTACLPLATAPQDVVLPTLMPVAAVPEFPTATPDPTATIPPTHTAIPLPTNTPPPTLTPTITPTPDPYAGYTIDDLRARSYGDGTLQIVEVIEELPRFTRYLITYPSDGLTVYGFMNVPKNVDAPLPVVLLLHGYVNPSEYTTKAYTTPHADSLANAGFLVIHPNYRNYPPSDTGENPLRIGFAIDVLNLIALVQKQGGEVGPLQLADPTNINLWGHSMGGGVALRVLVVNQDIRAAVLYGSMSADEYLNHQKIFEWTDGRSGQEELAIPQATMARLAPINYLDDITAAISIHHGTADGQVPFSWSADLCDQLRTRSKSVTCYTYEGQPHYFTGAADELFRQRVLNFFTQN